MRAMENVPRENIDRDGAGDDNKETKDENEASLLGKPALAKTATKTDLVLVKKGGEKEEEVQQQPHKRQMDGGMRAWLIVLSSFMCNGLIFGVINSYSLVYVELQKILEANGVQEASGKAGELTFLFIYFFKCSLDPIKWHFRYFRKWHSYINVKQQFPSVAILSPHWHHRHWSRKSVPNCPLRT